MASQASLSVSRLSPYSSSSASMRLGQSAQRAAASEPPVTVRLHELIQKFELILTALGEHKGITANPVYKELHKSMFAAQKAAMTFLKEQSKALVDAPKSDTTPALKYTVEQVAKQIGTLTLFRQTIKGLQKEMREIAASLPQGKKAPTRRNLTNCLDAAQASAHVFLTSSLVPKEGKVPVVAEAMLAIDGLNALQAKTLLAILNSNNKKGCSQATFDELKRELDAFKNRWVVKKHTPQKVDEMLDAIETNLSLLRLLMLQTQIIGRISSDRPFSEHSFNKLKKEVEAQRSAWAAKKSSSTEIGDALNSIDTLLEWIDSYCDEASQRTALMEEFNQLRQDVGKLFEEGLKKEFESGAKEQAAVSLRGRFNDLKSRQQQLVQKIEPETWPSALSALGMQVEKHPLANKVCAEIKEINELAERADGHIDVIETQNSRYPNVTAGLRMLRAELVQTLLNANVMDSTALDGLKRRCAEQKRQWGDLNLQSTPVVDHFRSIDDLFGWIKSHCDAAYQKSVLMGEIASLRYDASRLHNEHKNREFEIGANEKAVAHLRSRLNDLKNEQQQLVQKLKSEVLPNVLVACELKAEDLPFKKALSLQMQELNDQVKAADAWICFHEKQNSDYGGVVAKLREIHEEFAQTLSAASAMDAKMIEDWQRRCAEQKSCWQALNLQSILVTKYFRCFELVFSHLQLHLNEVVVKNEFCTVLKQDLRTFILNEEATQAAGIALKGQLDTALQELETLIATSQSMRKQTMEQTKHLLFGTQLIDDSDKTKALRIAIVNLVLTLNPVISQSLTVSRANIGWLKTLSVGIEVVSLPGTLAAYNTTKGNVHFAQQNRQLDGNAQDMASAEAAIPPSGFIFKPNGKNTPPSDVLKSLKEVMGTVMLTSTHLSERKEGREGVATRICEIKNAFAEALKLLAQEESAVEPPQNDAIKKSLLAKWNALDKLQAQEEAKHQLIYDFQESVFLFFEFMAQSQELRVVRYQQNAGEATWNDSVAKINAVEEKFKAMSKKLFELGWLATDLSADESVDWKTFVPTTMWEEAYAKFVEKFSKPNDDAEVNGLREELLARFQRLWSNSAGARQELLGEVERFRYLRTREGAAHTQKWTQGLHKGVVDPIVDGVSGVLGVASNAVSGAFSYLGSFSPFGSATLPAGELTSQVAEDASLTSLADEPSPVSSTKALSSDVERIFNSDEERGNSSNSDDEGEKISHQHIE